MALWRDPLDELIEELDRIVPPETSTWQQESATFFQLLREAQAEVVDICFSPEATLPLEEQAKLPASIPNPNSAISRLCDHLQRRRSRAP